ncbi:N-acetyltransferase [Streptomyces hygroscopicus]|uniref:GNAT family N-acetyltransferase n=1 Tax=Streptomyces hygroscopicus TaxID=1912 RepID=UPI00069119B6
MRGHLVTASETITVERLDGAGAAQAEDAFTLVYAEAFTEPPYCQTSKDVEVNFRRFRSQVRKATFRAALARTGEGVPVGIAYGYPLSAHTGWWDRLITPVDDELRREDGHRTFGLMELAVRAPWRRLGVARRMHEAVLTGTTTERVLLNARPDVEAAQAAYRSWGYHKVGEAHPWEGAVLHDVMVLDLRGRPHR